MDVLQASFSYKKQYFLIFPIVFFVFPVGMSTTGLMEPTSRSPSNAPLPSTLIISWPGCKTSLMMRRFSLQRLVRFLFSLSSQRMHLYGLEYSVHVPCPGFSCVLHHMHTEKPGFQSLSAIDISIYWLLHLICVGICCCFYKINLGSFETREWD